MSLLQHGNTMLTNIHRCIAAKRQFSYILSPISIAFHGNHRYQFAWSSTRDKCSRFLTNHHSHFAFELSCSLKFRVTNASTGTMFLHTTPFIEREKDFAEGEDQQIDLELKVLKKDPEIKILIKNIMADFTEYDDAENRSEISSSSFNDSDKVKDLNYLPLDDEGDINSSDSDSTSDSDSSDSESSDDEDDIEKDDFGLDRYRRGAVTKEDVDADMLKYDYEEFSDDIILDEQDVVEERILPITLDRGKHGVFDVEELVALLRDEAGSDICVLRVPEEIGYVEHMVIVSGRSTRHLRAMAEIVQWVFKHKRGKADMKSCRIEGLPSTDWLAMDIGNLALHLFLPDTRRTYDLETLWTVGPSLDDKTASDTHDPYANLFAEHHWQVTDAVSAPEHSDEIKEQVDYDGMESVSGWHGDEAARD